MHSHNARLIDRIIDIARGLETPGSADRENRVAVRLPYEGQVALVQIEPRGDKTAPALLQAQNISFGGLCVRSPNELVVGSRGAVLLLRSDGEAVILPAKVVYCKSSGRQTFECGLEFEPALAAVTMRDFHDARGNLPDLRPAAAA